MNAIEWLQSWYQAQCDDEWEHRYGISIETLDNPGWQVVIDLSGTPLQDAGMNAVGEVSSVNHSGLEGDHDWMVCKVEEARFIGAGGPASLLSICEVFRDWAIRSTAAPVQTPSATSPP